MRNLHCRFVLCSKSTVEISQNFVAFSEYMNFIKNVQKNSDVFYGQPPWSNFLLVLQFCISFTQLLYFYTIVNLELYKSNLLFNQIITRLMSIGLFNSAIRPSPKTNVVYNIGINNQQIHKKYSGVPTKVFIEQMSFYGCKII